MVFIDKIMDMESLHRERKVTIYIPDDYKTSNKRYPVLYINDGQNAFFDEESFLGVSWGFYEYVKENNLEIIMVAIPCNFEGHKRVDEYGPWVVGKEITKSETGKNAAIGGEGDLYLQFIIEQLKPYIDTTYPTLRNDTALCGSSMGGVISLYAGLKYPNVFKKCAALSTAVWFYLDEFTDLINEADLDPLQCLYLDLGGNEGNGDERTSLKYLESNDYISELLSQKTPTLYFEYFEDAGHSEVEWRKRVPIFMKAFYESENM